MGRETQQKCKKKVFDCYFCLNISIRPGNSLSETLKETQIK